MTHPPKLVYVAGPISADTPEAREANICRAEDLYTELLSRGIAAVCVHSTARRLWGRVKEADALKSDFATLARCDAVVLTQGWQHSTGTALEITMASDLCMPIYESMAELLAAAQQPAQTPAYGEIGGALAV